MSVYLTKKEISKIIEDAPEGTTPEGIIAALRNRGAMLEGYSETTTAEKQKKKTFVEKLGNLFVPLVGTAARVSQLPYYEKLQKEGMVGYNQIADSLSSQLKDRNLSPQRKKYLIEKFRQSYPGIIETHPDLNKTTKQILGEAITTGVSLLTAGEMAGAGKVATEGILSSKFLSIPSGFTKKAIASRAGISALYSSAYGLGEAAQKDQDIRQTIETVAKRGITGAVLSLGFDATALGIKKIIEKIPGLTAWFSGAPKSALQYQYEKAGMGGEESAGLKESIKELKQQRIPEKEVLDNIQVSARDMRLSLSKEYNAQLKDVTAEYAGEKILLNPYQQKLLKNVDSVFPLRNMPKSLSKPQTFEEMNNLYTELNAYYSKPSVSAGERGAVLRELRNQLKDMMVSNFGGEGGDYAQLLKNYSDKVSIINAMSNVFKPYAIKDPKIQRTAVGQLNTVFKENAWAYVDTIADFESMTGQNFLDGLSYLATKQIAPTKIGEIGFGEVLRLLLIPFGLGSPRAAAFYSRGAGKAVEQTIPKIIESPAIRKAIIPGMTELMK